MWQRAFRALTLDIDIAADGDDIIAMLEAVFGCYGAALGGETVRYRVASATLELHRDDELIYSAEDRLDLVPALEADLYRQIVRYSAPGLWLLHAAAVVMDGKAIVLAGQSGDGKSSAATRLVGQGAGYLSDEYVAIDAAGLVTGLSRPVAFVGRDPTVAIPSGFTRADYPVRIDGRVESTALYHPPSELIAAQPAELAYLARIRYQPAASPATTRLSAGEAIAELWECTMNADQEVLRSAARVIEGAPVFAVSAATVAELLEQLSELG